MSERYKVEVTKKNIVSTTSPTGYISVTILLYLTKSKAVVVRTTSAGAKPATGPSTESVIRVKTNKIINKEEDYEDIRRNY